MHTYEQPSDSRPIGDAGHFSDIVDITNNQKAVYNFERVEERDSGMFGKLYHSGMLVKLP